MKNYNNEGKIIAKALKQENIFLTQTNEKLHNEILSLKNQIENKEQRLLSKDKELEEIKNEIATKESHLKNLNENIDKIRNKYGSGILNKLKEFDGYNLLEKYISNTYAINRRSKEKIELTPELKEYFRANFKLEHDPHLYMDHILFNFMRQDAISLMNVVDYEITKDRPVNLHSSYFKSVELAKELMNCEGSLAWYINQRIPKTYIEANSVDFHLDNIFEIFYEKPLVDVRRVHLFYKKYLINNIYSLIPFKNTQALFSTLLLEFLHGIDNRVLCIESYENVRNILFEKGDDFSNNYLFLLDFVLYFSKNNHSRKAYLTGEPHILCADFVAENPSEYLDKTDEEEFNLRTEEYEKDKVYDFDNPLIYSIFKNYFLTIWNLEKYANYLEVYLEKLKNKTNNLELKAFYNTIKNEIKIYDFLDFWRLAKESYGDANLLDEKIFDSKYLWKKFDFNGKSKKEILVDLQQTISSFEISEDKTETFKNLLIHFREKGYILRDIYTTNCYK